MHPSAKPTTSHPAWIMVKNLSPPQVFVVRCRDFLKIMSAEAKPLVNDPDTGRPPLHYYNTYQQSTSSRGQRRRRGSSRLGESIRNLVNQSLTFSGRSCSVRDFGGTASVGEQIFNLVKNLVGSGVLALPSGVAAFADAPSAIIPASIHIILMGAIFAYFFLILGKTCRITHTATYREVWEETMGETGATVVATVNMLKPALGNLAYSMILADTFKSLFHTIGLVHVTRAQSLFFITVVALLPLCLLKNLKVLSPFSLAGMVSMFLTAAAMGVRYFDGTYDAATNGKFVQGLHDEMKPRFGDTGASGALSARVLVFLCMVFEAFVAHYNAPRFYTELKNATIARFGAVVSYAFGLSSLNFILIAGFGFLTFGSHCDGYILNNYSTHDHLATFCRVAVAFSLIFTYPLTFMGFRDGILDVLDVPMAKQTSTNINIVSVFLLSILTALAMLFTDLGMVNAVGGGTLVPFVVFVFPAFMYRAAVYGRDSPPTASQLVELNIVFLLMVGGFILGAIGVWLAISGEM